MKKIILLLITLSFFSACTKDFNYNTGLFSDKMTKKAVVLINKGNLKKLDSFINRNHEIVEKSFSDLEYTALHYAVIVNSYDAVELLLSKGFNPSVQADDKTTPLGIACFKGAYTDEKDKENNKKITKVLLEYGADPNKGFFYPERTPLMLLSHEKDFETSKERIDILINDGHVDLNYQNECGYTAATVALESPESIRIAQYLICNLHANVNTVFYENKTQLLNNINPQTPLDLLKNLDFPQDSEEYKLKLEIATEFKNQGLE